MKTRSLLQPRVGAVLALKDRALLGDSAAVHDFRVAARSLRAALRPLTGTPNAHLVRNVRRCLKAATRALAETRDRDVGRSLLAKLPGGSPKETGSKRRLVGLSASHRRVALARCVSLWPRKLDRHLIELLERPEPRLASIIRRMRAEAWQQRRRALNLLDVLGRRYDPLRLHELRRRIRGLRYAIEVLAEVDSAATARVTRLKPLQGALGDTQDRIVLSRWLRHQAEAFRRSDAAFALVLRREASRFRAQSLEAHARFLRLKPREILARMALHVDGASDHPLCANHQNQPPARRAHAV